MKRFANLITGRTLLIVVLGLLIAIPFGCTKKESKEIKIGVITPLTGEGATYGEATKQGLDLALEEINKAGGVDGKNVKLLYEDSQIKPRPATGAIHKLITIDKVPVIIGAFGSSVTLSIAPIAERNKVVLFSASSTADDIKGAGDYIFRNVPPNRAQGKTAAKFAIEKLGKKRAAVFHINNDYGISLTKSFQETFKQEGGDLLITETYNQGDRDFKTQLSKIKEKNPDVVFYPGHYQESGLILKQARELGIKSEFIGGDGSYSSELIKIAGDAAEGSYYTLMAMGYGVADDEIKAFTEAFQKKYGIEPDVYSGYAYDALKIIVRAIENGGYASDGIKNALYKTKNFKGITGLTSFDEFGEVDKPFYIYEVRNGKFGLFK